MYSLTDLNDYSSTTLNFFDERPASWIITPNIAVINSSVNTIYSSEGNSHQLPIPFTLSSLQASSGMTLTVNVAGYTGSQVEWGGLPANVIYSNPTTGIYSVGNITTLSQWNTVRTAFVNLGPDTSGNVGYTANLRIAPGAGNVAAWNITAIISDSAEINTGTLGNIYYDEYYGSSFNSGLLVVDTNPSGTYWANISLSDNSAGNLTSNGIGGTSSFTSNILRINGNKAQVNSHLGNIQFTPSTEPIGYDEDFILTYQVRNITSNIISFATQNMLIGNKFDEVTDIYRDRNYISNQVNAIFANNTPFLSEVTPGNYTISLRLEQSIGFLTTESGYITRPGWDQPTLTYSFSGTLAQCNDALANLRFFPVKNTITNTVVFYTQRRNGIFQLSQTFLLLGSVNTNPIPGTGAISYTSPGSYTFVPTVEQYLYLDCDVFLVGSGGITAATQTAFTSYATDQSYDLLFNARNGTIAQKRAAEANVTPFINSSYSVFGGGGGGGAYSILTSVAVSPSITIVVPSAGAGPARFGGLTAQGGAAGSVGTVTGSSSLSTGGTGGTSATGIPGSAGSQATLARPQFTYINSFGGGQFVRGQISSPAFGGGGGGSATTVTFAGNTYSGIIAGAAGGSFTSGTPGSGNSPGLVVLNFVNNTSTNISTPGGGNVSIGGNSSAYFPGTTNSYIQGTLNSAVGTSDFTVEFWVYPTVTTSNERGVFDTRTNGGSSSDGFCVRTNSTNQFLFIPFSSTNSIAWTRTNNAWQHIAVVRTGGSIYIYSNGVLQGSTISGGTNNYTGTTVRLGAFRDDASSTSGVFTGYIDEVRYSSIARYFGNFTPVTSPFTSDAQTKLLLHFDGTQGSNSISDSSGFNRTMSAFGNAVINTTTYKF